VGTRRRFGYLIAAALFVVVGCTAGDDGSESAGGTTPPAEDATGESTPAATGPAPGVTDDAVKVGVTFVDTEALVAVGLNYDLGDHEAVYTALFDAINAEGGINGRQIEPVFAPVDPTAPTPAEEACVQLTEDEDVFVVVGFFLTDAVNCPVATHETAVVGGEMTPQRIEGATAPWLTWLADSGRTDAVLRVMDEAGELEGTIGVYANARDEELVNDSVVPALEEEFGVDVVEVGLEEGADTTALQASTRTIAERFEAAGVDTVVLVGASGQDWPSAMDEDASYRPKLLFLDSIALTAFATNEATTDTSVLEGAVAGGGYGPDQARYEEPAMQECIQILEDAGLETPVPEDIGDDDPSNQPYQAAFQACPDAALMRAWFEAAGDDLNYGTLEAAVEGLEVTIPGDPEPRTYGPPPDSDGDPAAYLFRWDEEGQGLVRDEG
jgi:ABC-type branched-subunit amino acid transport system substrate-binding protein